MAMDRSMLVVAVTRRLRGMTNTEKITYLAGTASYLEGRMRRLAVFPQTMYKGFVKRELTNALGMSLGVHKQLLGRLTFVPRAVILKGGGGV